MRLPKQGRILASDFPKEQEFMPRLLAPINSFITDVTQGLNRNLTFQENLSAQILTATVDGIYPLDLRWDLPSLPIAAWVGQCREVTGAHTVPAAAVYVDWEVAPSGQFRINGVVGVTPSSTSKYTITIIAITG